MYNYVYNGSSWVPALATADGQQKYWINMANASYGEVQYNLTIGEKIIFSLGGILDNFANGWIRVVENLIVDGDLNVSQNLNVVGNITGASPVKIIGGSDVKGNVNVSGDMNVLGVLSVNVIKPINGTNVIIQLG
jgi:hypothetical protein